MKNNLSVEHIANRATELVNRTGAYILVGMMLLTAVDVAGRYLFNRPVAGTYELTELMMAILGSFCLAYTQARKGHVGVTFLVDQLQSKSRAAIDSIGYFVGLGMWSLIAWQTVIQAGKMKLAAQVTPLLKVPIYPFFWVLVFGSVLIFMVLLVDLRNSLTRLKGSLSWHWLALGLGLILVLLIAVAAVQGKGLPWRLSPHTVGFIDLGLLLIFMFSGIPVGFAMGMTGFLGAAYLSGTGPALSLMGIIPYKETASYTISVVALFILMGMFAFYSGLSEDLYRTAYKWLGHLPGGLAMATAAACAGFAAVSGSSVASAATMGTVSLPEMKKYKYSDELATGVIVAAGTMGILIPPSIILVIYGLITEQSIGRLFIAGIIPGFLEAILYIITIYFLCRFFPKTGPPGPATTLKEKFASLIGTWQTLLLFLVVIGGIYMGVFTPNEAAGIGAFGAFLFALLKGRFTRQNFKNSLVDAGTLSAMCILIIVGAVLFNYFLTVSRLPSDLASWISQLPMSRYVIMGFIILVYFVLGCFMSSMAIILLTVPIFYPIAITLGFDGIWFGILVVIMTEIAAITPPYGINLFIIKGIAKDVSMGTIYKGVIPFVFADIVRVSLLVAFPQMATWLPGLMKGG